MSEQPAAAEPSLRSTRAAPNSTGSASHNDGGPHQTPLQWSAAARGRSGALSVPESTSGASTTLQNR